MNNIEVYLVVEGQTEQTFVRKLLAPYVASRNNIFLHAALIGKVGGSVSFEKAKNDIENFLKQQPNTYISTMVDFFRMDTKWPGYQKVCTPLGSGRKMTAKEKAEIIEGETITRLNELFPSRNVQNRVIPYVQMHEFEALLFSDAGKLAENSFIDLGEIKKILCQYESPEDINEDPQKAPSKRLGVLNRGYKKTVTGIAIASAIGIEKMREQCKNFDTWLNKIEQLAVDDG